ncbi:MAG: hypothetical protein ACLRQF_15595 [Thomasclavelia ramosa]
MVAKIKNIKFSNSIKYSCTFVCNHVTYGVRHLIETKYQGKEGFIHILYTHK